jgi:exodeoxyribonuclease VII small subunit
MTTKTTKEKESLKEILAKLDVIVGDLNAKDIDVEKGMEKFKEGIALVKIARERLQKTENEFITLKKELEEK